MSSNARLAADAGGRIIGCCCGVAPAHLAAMRAALDLRDPGPWPSLDKIVGEVGPFTAPAVAVRRKASTRVVETNEKNWLKQEPSEANAGR